MRRRLLVLVPLAAVALASAGHAAPTKVPQVKDAKGDAVGGNPGTDVVSTLFTTVGKGSGKAYVPKSLVITLTLAAPPLAGPGVTYEVEAASADCGDIAFTYEPGTPYEDVTGLNGWVDWGRCGDVALLTPKVKGSTVTWTFSLKSTPLELGDELTRFRVRVDPSNPLIPFPSSATGTELGLIDAATGDGPWQLG